MVILSRDAIAHSLAEHPKKHGPMVVTDGRGKGFGLGLGKVAFADYAPLLALIAKLGLLALASMVCDIAEHSPSGRQRFNFCTSSLKCANAPVVEIVY